MDYLPICIDLKQRHCLIVGGGDVAARKAGLLLKAQAQICVVAPDISPSMQALLSDQRMTWIQAAFAPAHLDGQTLVIAATDDQSLNRFVYQQARAQRILVNVADCPELCDFILPSILDRSPLLITVSSSGHSPVLARQLRAKLETLIPPAYSRLAELLGRYRESVKSRFRSIQSRRRFWEKVLHGKVAEHILAGREAQGEAELNHLLEHTQSGDEEVGEVYLIGAGPGDPELLTFKALRLMQQADVVFYDRLVSQEVRDLVRREAEQIYVGKQRAWHAVRQEEINQLLVEHARQGKRVVRLKGGDPFIFGRGGEEIETLAQENIPFQVVPGITAASGCACYAGIPLTHRDYAQSCIFVTGQLKEGELNLNWSALVQPRQTVVIYMGLAGLPVLSQRLQQYGLAPDTPAALVQQGTTAQQKVWVTTITQLPELAKREQPVAPTLVIIGDVVHLHDQLKWL